MFDENQRPRVNPMELLLRAALHAKSTRPKTITDWLATQSRRGMAAQFAIDGGSCRGCDARNGIAISVMNPAIDEIEIPPSHRIVITTRDPHGGLGNAAMSVEDCKQLVNRLGEAIAAAELVDASV